MDEEEHAMFSVIFVTLLGIVSAALVLAAAAFYASWETQNRMDQELDTLIKRRPKA